VLPAKTSIATGQPCQQSRTDEHSRASVRATTVDEVSFAVDSLLEGRRFELSVPPRGRRFQNRIGRPSGLQAASRQVHPALGGAPAFQARSKPAR